MIKNMMVLFVKGIPIGISNTLPGISGGTIALVLHIYDEIIEALKTFNLRVLLPVILGAAAGILLTAGIVTYLIDHYPQFIFAFIFGLILASAKVTFDDIERRNIIVVMFLLAGILIAFSVSGHSPSESDMVSINWGHILGGGFLASVSMLLPGISGATVLVMLGMYEFILHAVTTLNISVLIVFGVGIVAGVIGLAWIISYVLKKYRSELMAFLTGLIIGSALAVIPDNIGVIEIGGTLTGMLVIYVLNLVGQKV